jgi:hypothetical protein
MWFSGVTVLAVICTTSAANGFSAIRPMVFARGGALPMSTKGKMAGADAPPVQLGWDTHNPVVGYARIGYL